MAIWKDNTASRQTPTPAPEAREPARIGALSKPELAPSAAAAPVTRADTGVPRKESLIAADITIEGSIRHPADGEPWEYTVVVSIRNDRGEEIARKLIGVGAMNPNEQRTFTLSVEAVFAKRGQGKGGTRH